MKRVPFGKTGLSVSPLGFGAAPAAYLGAHRQQTIDMLNELLDAGMNVIDTAASYPGSEQFIGENFSHRREDLVLISKCGGTIPESDAPAWSQTQILASVDRSLRWLNTDRVDIMLLHSCDLETLERGEALGALVEARDTGKIRFAGYSGDNEAAAYAATLQDVAVIETSINIVDQINIDHVLPDARQNLIGIVAKRPIANAAWKPPHHQPGMYQSYAKTYTERFAKLSLSVVDLEFTGSPQEQWPQIALRFTLSIPGVHTAIVGTTNPANARANLKAVEMGPLQHDLVEKIRAAYRRADPDGKWRGQT
jgi:aryl-alcohol dehydrogenase-like predicted oxidoreductase